MRKTITLLAATFVVAIAAAAVSARSEEKMPMHGMSHAPDARHVVEFPAPMREHMLAEMRDHLEVIGDILAALSADDGAKAAKIADAHLSLASPHAAACKPDAASSGDMAAMMARHMPEEMRALGFTMHESASKFAEESAKLKAGGDMKPALAALAQVTQGCAACHSAYRLK